MFQFIDFYNHLNHDKWSEYLKINFVKLCATDLGKDDIHIHNFAYIKKDVYQICRKDGWVLTILQWINGWKEMWTFKIKKKKKSN